MWPVSCLRQYPTAERGYRVCDRPWPGQRRTCQILWRASAWESPTLFRRARRASGEFLSGSSVVLIGGMRGRGRGLVLGTLQCSELHNQREAQDLRTISLYWYSMIGLYPYPSTGTSPWKCEGLWGLPGIVRTARSIFNKRAKERSASDGTSGYPKHHEDGSGPFPWKPRAAAPGSPRRPGINKEESSRPSSELFAWQQTIRITRRIKKTEARITDGEPLKGQRTKVTS